MGAAAQPQPQQGQGQNPGGSLSNIFNYLKQFAAGGGALQQAAGAPGQQGGGGQQPQPQPVQDPSIQAGQPNGILESIGRAILGKVSGSPGMQDTTELQKQIKSHMDVLDQQKKAASKLHKVIAAPASKGPQAQADPSQPFHDLFHKVMSGLQS